jgi:hypothetical protein
MAKRYSWRLPVLLALVGMVIGAALDVACPTAPLVSGPYARLDAAEQVIKVSLDVYRGFAPKDVRVTILATHDDTNREICIFISGPLRQDSSCFPHRAADVSQRSVLFSRLPAGDYEFWAVLIRQAPDDKQVTHSSTHVTAELN